MNERSFYFGDCSRVIIKIHEPVPNAHFQKTKQNDLSEYHAQMWPNDFRGKLQEQPQILYFRFSPQNYDPNYYGDDKGNEPLPDVQKYFMVPLEKASDLDYRKEHAQE